MNRRAFLLSLSSLVLAAVAGQKEKPRPAIGINLAGIADWNTELPFVDVFRASRPWISQRKGAQWGGGPQLKLDQHGWVKELEPDCWSETLMCTIDGGHYPSGRYTVVYDGKGTLHCWNAGRIVEQADGRAIVEVDASKGAIFLRITSTDPNDYLRNIHVIMPGFEDSWELNPWNPTFLKRWASMRCLRFMDWMKTNGSPIETWEDRPTPEDATFSRKGVPLEWMIDVCNRLGAAPWFCMPHQADDEYVRRFAQMVYERLDRHLPVYIEYSNEVWNSIFSQHQYAAQRGQQLGFSERPWEAAWRYTAYRSVQIFEIWERVFGTADRLVRVLPSQAANPRVSEEVLTFRDAYRRADALGIAPYISMIVSPQSRPSAEEVAGWTVDQVLDYVEEVALPRSIRWMQQQKRLADQCGVRLVAYEAGQHLVGSGGAENNDRLTELFIEANRHPRMGRIYDRYLQAWVEVGGDLLCHFSSVSKWTKWGSWGLLEYADQDPATSPKFQQLMKWAQRLNS